MRIEFITFIKMVNVRVTIIFEYFSLFVFVHRLNRKDLKITDESEKNESLCISPISLLECDVNTWLCFPNDSPSNSLPILTRRVLVKNHRKVIPSQSYNALNHSIFKTQSLKFPILYTSFVHLEKRLLGQFIVREMLYQ